MFSFKTIFSTLFIIASLYLLLNSIDIVLNGSLSGLAYPALCLALLIAVNETLLFFASKDNKQEASINQQVN